MEKKKNEFCVEPPRDPHSLFIFLIQRKKGFFLSQNDILTHVNHHGIIYPSDSQLWEVSKNRKILVAC